MRVYYNHHKQEEPLNNKMNKLDKKPKTESKFR